MTQPTTRKEDDIETIEKEVLRIGLEKLRNVASHGAKFLGKLSSNFDGMIKRLKNMDQQNEAAQ